MDRTANQRIKMKSFTIGNVQMENHTVLAPLAGITNLPFRRIAKEAGCGLVCSEMVSSSGLVYKSVKTKKLLENVPEEKPLSIQIFGAKADVMADAAALVEDAGADILDINFGCSVKKILKSGSGSALMKEPMKAAAILESVKKAIHIPLTVKIRSGWDASGDQALEIARIAEESGVNAIAVHPRTAVQGFRGVSDWSLIKAVKEQVNIPVIGNGDICTPDDAIRMIQQTGCDAVMIGRAAIGNPWIFSGINERINGNDPQPYDLDSHFDIIKKYLKASIECFGEEHACRMMRSRLNWFVKGLYGSSHFRYSTRLISKESEAIELIDSYYELVTQHNDTEQST